MRRRDFVAGLSTLGLIAPSGAQQGSKVYRVAYVSPSTPVDVNKQRATHTSPFKVLFTELKARKYTLGQNLVVDFYSAEGKVERYRPLAREVIATQPDVIHTQSTRLLLVFRDETKTVPIVAFTGDPVEYGIVQTLAKPGGNITGVVSTAGTAVMGKYLELVREVIPNPQKVAFMTSSTGWAGPLGKAMRTAAERLGISLVPLLFDDVSAAVFERLLDSAVESRAQAIVLSETSEIFTYQDSILRGAISRRLPTFAAYRSFAQSGATCSLGVNLDEMFGELARQIAHILDGASPGEIPFFLPTTFELVVNRKAAAELGLQVSPALLARADEVIE